VSRRDATSALAASDPAALRAEIERTRALLGETVSALAAKTDVKARARTAIGEAASGVRHQFHGAGRTVARGVGGRARTAGRTVARGVGGRARTAGRTVARGVGGRARTAGRRIVAAPGRRVALLGGATALTALLVTVIVRRRR
jgi:hypothetical protein